MSAGVGEIVGLHHAQITVPPAAVDAARAFYCDLLGLPEVEKPDVLKPRGGFWLRVGDRQVHVGIEDGVDRAATKAHLAYEVRDLGTFCNRLRTAGVTLLDSVPIPGADRVEIRDPFGNRVEFIEPKE